MFRKVLVLLPVLLVFLIFVSGCGIKSVLPSKEVPQLRDYSNVVLVFFNEKPSQEYDSLPILMSYTIGTRMSIKFEDKLWSFDQTEEIHPITDKLKELGIQPGDICQNSQLAKKLAEATDADLIIVGRLDKPEFTKEESGKIEYEMADVSVTGAARYYAIYQTAILRADFMIVDPKAGQSIWDGRIIGYKKYKTRYRTGNPPVSQPETLMLADVRKDLVQKVVDKLAPAMTAGGA